jgi:hypothetical protein
MKILEIWSSQELSKKESEEIHGGGIIVFAFLAGLAVAYYEQRIKEK